MFEKMFGTFKNLFRSRSGQGITEYAAILAIVVALAILVSANDGFTDKISTLYTDLAKKIQAINEPAAKS